MDILWSLFCVGVGLFAGWHFPQPPWIKTQEDRIRGFVRQEFDTLYARLNGTYKK